MSQSRCPVQAAQQKEMAEKQADEQRKADSRRVFEQQQAQRSYEAQQAAQADESRRQAVLQYLLNQRMNQNTAQPYRLPVPETSTTDCRQYLNGVRCTTR